MVQSLERVVHERLAILQDAIRSKHLAQQQQQPPQFVAPGFNTTSFYGEQNPLEARIQTLELQLKQAFARTLAINTLMERIDQQATQIAELKARLTDVEPVGNLLPRSPMQGIEVVPKREVAISDTAEPLSYADRLLLNKKARKALEAEEMGERPAVIEEAEETEEAEEAEEAEEEVMEEVEEEVVEEEVEEEVEEAEEAAEEAEEAAEEEAMEVELEEFEYKGSSYYRDTDNNVFMADEDGELVADAIGVWNPVKQRIVVKKPDA